MCCTSIDVDTRRCTTESLGLVAARARRMRKSLEAALSSASTRPRLGRHSFGNTKFRLRILHLSSLTVERTCWRFLPLRRQSGCAPPHRRHTADAARWRGQAARTRHHARWARRQRVHAIQGSCCAWESMCSRDGAYSEPTLCLSLGLFQRCGPAPLTPERTPAPVPCRQS